MPLVTNASMQLVDQFGRHKHKLRISLTDRCNFRCSYCMPDKPEWLAKKDILSFEELLKFCEVMVHLGIQHIRLTGGEPLMRQGVVNFIHDLNRLKAHGLQRISMTTNAFYLKKYAYALQQAGLDDLNISLDSIDPNTFQNMTKCPLEPVLQGIAAAQQLNIPIKLNCVLVAGKNDHEIIELTQWAYQQNIALRFIEYMPLDQPEHWQPEKVITEDEIIQKLTAHFQIEKQQRQNDPATIYRLNNDYKLGIISTISKPFCQSCDRLRLTATGELFTCLFANSGTPLRALLQQNDSSLTATILNAVWHKKAGFIAHQQAPSRKISMHAIGG
ncbi:GTP 3',8-cyclase MoaA [Acinetobacter piscicola]|uniref:GTP 3',8-cyclase MoaA n=1 Tax=Acinetobacter piscicola TaxID=2006115 RepID=UPI001E28691D|nr:GTP 3',8-cyclase MoaA [Acinetobacter piscicola]